MPPAPQSPTEQPPRHGLGLMRLRDEGGGGPAALVGAAVAAGVALLDRAEMYGNEELVGRAVAPYRDQVVLCSKFGVYWGPSGRHDDWSVRADPATVREAVDGSLRRLQVDVIDLYYLHHRSEETPVEETVGAMAELVTVGKIRAVGLSNVTVEDVRRAHAVHPVQAVQEEWSLAQRGVEAMLPVLGDLGITLVAHSPLGHGLLATGPASPVGRLLHELAERYDATPAQLALAWVHARGRRSGQPVVPLVGTTRVSHLAANVAAAGLALAEDDLALLDAASATEPAR